jgi:hypothetical protein
MRVVMTLLVRDEADVVDAHLAFHLSSGIDLVIATDNRSQDGTTEILERFAAKGLVHLLHEDGDDLRQTEWVTRMARLAATEFEADWVVNSDADEFWLPRQGTLQDVLAVVPERYGVVRGAWRVFVPRPNDGRPFAERMTARLCRPAYHDHPFSTDRKSIHRAVPDVRVGRGNHEAFGDGLVPVLGWFPVEVLHFPIRSLEQCMRKYVTQYLALGNNPDKGTPGIVERAYDAYLSDRPEDFYNAFLVDDWALEQSLADGTLALDTRLRDALRAISSGRQAPTPTAPSLEDRTLYAAETSVIPEADLGQYLRSLVEDVEVRIGRMEDGATAGIRRALTRGRRP